MVGQSGGLAVGRVAGRVIGGQLGRWSGGRWVGRAVGCADPPPLHPCTSTPFHLQSAWNPPPPCPCTTLTPHPFPQTLWQTPSTLPPPSPHRHSHIRPECHPQGGKFLNPRPGFQLCLKLVRLGGMFRHAAATRFTSGPCVSGRTRVKSRGQQKSTQHFWKPLRVTLCKYIEHTISPTSPSGKVLF